MLKHLQENRDIIIKPADKGGATVIMNRTDYRKEALRQLSNQKYYQRINEPRGHTNQIYIRDRLQVLLFKGFIDLPTLHYLGGPENFDVRQLYLLPKIHKPKDRWPSPNMPEGRPIVSDTNSESSRIAEYIDSFLNPISSINFSHIKNSFELIAKIQHTSIGPSTIFVTADVKSLYTNMNIDRIMQTVRLAFHDHPDPKRADGTLLDLLEFTLRNNDFLFDDTPYLQIFGTAMGKKYAPALANIYLKDFDLKATSHPDFHPRLYHRFLDDIFFLWDQGPKRLDQYKTYLNSLIEDIEISFESDPWSIPFLDIHLHRVGNQIETETYFKPTDTHQLLHKASYHPAHVTQGVLKSQFIRFKRLSSNRQAYNQTCKVLHSYIRHRGYNRYKFNRLKNQIWNEWQAKPTGPQEHTGRILPIIMGYHSLGKILTRSYRNILKEDPTFQNKRIVTAFTRGRSLRNILVRSAFK